MSLPTTLPGPVIAAPTDTTPIYTQRPQIGFATRNVQPPSGVYVTVDDVLHVSAWNSVPNLVLNVTYRVLLYDGTIKLGGGTVSLTSARARNDATFNMPEGFIFSVVVQPSTSGVLRGQCFVELDIARVTGSQPLDRQPLLSDYVTSANTFGWPGGTQRTSIEGPGALQSAHQSIGGLSSFTITVPTNARWLMHSVQFVFTTDAVAGNRVLVVRAFDGFGFFAQFQAIATQAPSVSSQAYVAEPVALTSLPASNLTLMPISSDLVLKAGDTLSSLVLNGDSGDLFVGSVDYRYEEWLEPTS